MDDLRLIGVHEDGEHLLLTDGTGDRFRLRIDDALRAAIRRDRPRLGQLQIESEGGVRPREVQAMIRAGASAAEVAERTGWPLEKVARYEGPILAERVHVASLARQVRLRTRGATGAGADTLESRVTARLTDRGVDPDQVLWDAARSDDGAWSVSVSFPAGGRERTAAWAFDTGSRTVLPHDDEARWLTEEDLDDGPIPTPHAIGAAPGSAVYDVEAEGGVHEGRGREDRSADRRHDGHRHDGDPGDLMASVREHSTARGRRTGARRRTPATTPVDHDLREDALPLEQVTENATVPPAARGRHPRDHDLSGPEPSDEVAGPGPEAGPEESGPPTEAVPARRSAGTSRSGSRRKGRPSVPSWDDVMFGGRRN